MAEETKIEWTDSTLNPWIGCTKVSPACDHCYAEVSAPARVHKIVWGAKAERVRTKPGTWNLAKRWNAQHEAFFKVHGRRQRVFCASLADVFDNAVPVEWRRDLFALVMECDKLDWLLLTKRVGNVASMVPPEWLHPGGWPKHVRIGATIASQDEADRDIPKLLALGCPNFLSMEPLLGLVDLTGFLKKNPDGLKRAATCSVGIECRHGFDVCPICDGDPVALINWVIVGGESGHEARPMHPDWVRSLRDQCAQAGTPMLFKQWGEWLPVEEWNPRLPHKQLAIKVDGTMVSDDDAPQDVGGQRMEIVGKKAAGRLLDGIEHNGYPTA